MRHQRGTRTEEKLTIFKFSKASIQSLEVPQSGKVYYHDEKERGLSLYITSKGKITFFARKRVNSRDIRIVLGNFPDLTIEQARKKFHEARGLVAMGHDPHEEKRKAREMNKTFGQAFNEYMERYSKKQKRSWKYDEREVNKFLPHWFKRRIGSISKAEIQRLIEKVHDENGLYQANRLLERIRHIYNKTIEWGWEGTNPAVGVKKYKEKSRERFVLPNEMPYLLKALEVEHNQTVKDYFWMLLLTGARRTNTLHMRWEQINWEMKVWTIPMTKNGDSQKIPLIGKAMEILQSRKSESKSPWVFPSEDFLDQPLTNFKRPWKKLLQLATMLMWKDDPMYSELVSDESVVSLSYKHTEDEFKKIQRAAKKKNITLPVGLTDLHLHDIRRTFGSYQAITGASLQIIGKSLGHKSPLSTQVYARLNLDPVRDSIEKATAVMFG